MFFYKIFRTGKEILLTVCDEEIMGSKFGFKGKEITVNKAFYGQNKANEKEILDKAKKASVINAMGDNVVSLLTKNKIVNKNKVLNVGVKHAQVVTV